LIESGMPVVTLTAVADLVDTERFKTILRHYHDRSNGQPNAFVVGLAKTLIQAAYHYVGASPEHIAHLKRIAAKLPAIPFELTVKSKTFLEWRFLCHQTGET
jgi:hypothetical protein